MQKDTYEIMRQIEDDHWWFQARRKIIHSTIGSMRLPDSADILEIGCGTGGNIEMLSSFGNLTCVEMDKSAARLASERSKSPIMTGSLPYDLPKFDSKYDLVTLLDVIEHVDQDRISLEVVADLLKPGGQILITVPAFNFLWSRHDDENHHKRRYQKRGLREVTMNAGLSISYISYFNFFLFPPFLFARVFRKIFPYKESWQDMAIPNRYLNKTLSLVFSSERAIVGKFVFPFGSSILAICSKAQSDF